MPVPGFALGFQPYTGEFPASGAWSYEGPDNPAGTGGPTFPLEIQHRDSGGVGEHLDEDVPPPSEQPQQRELPPTAQMQTANSEPNASAKKGSKRKYTPDEQMEEFREVAVHFHSHNYVGNWWQAELKKDAELKSNSTSSWACQQRKGSGRK